MPKAIFVNLPVADLDHATQFYEAIGCTRNAKFSDHKASSMVWSEHITFQLLAREYFSGFAPKPIADPHAAAQVILCLSRDTREEVDGLVEAAQRAGGGIDVRAPIEFDFLYNRAFEDPDGHLFEVVWVNPAAMAGSSAEQAAA
jgi:hypothetical protein